ncbi:hypothetical protein PZB75_12340 [Streptomyces sp. AM 4-1-1]|uniref:hypothetical protein n=1 Tax=Streptomyces sp. AM 4-1-1 TaxID=3028710 RepID=UPI0023B8B81E|nr:hypothetical protein [Streptomyces sp. AM 4-1-1]WEH34086.1 hypothetical protein PZB75_12340 [Streptomyces sp. AM 4-1-1]
MQQRRTLLRFRADPPLRAFLLDQAAGHLNRLGIDEPVLWEPPANWATRRRLARNRKYLRKKLSLVEGATVVRIVQTLSSLEFTSTGRMLLQQSLSVIGRYDRVSPSQQASEFSSRGRKVAVLALFRNSTDDHATSPVDHCPELAWQCGPPQDLFRVAGADTITINFGLSSAGHQSASFPVRKEQENAQAEARQRDGETGNITRWETDDGPNARLPHRIEAYQRDHDDPRNTGQHRNASVPQPTGTKHDPGQEQHVSSRSFGDRRGANC